MDSPHAPGRGGRSFLHDNAVSADPAWPPQRPATAWSPTAATSPPGEPTLSFRIVDSGRAPPDPTSTSSTSGRCT